MQLLRGLLTTHPMIALAVGLAALALRLAVPSGFMPALGQGGFVLALCPDAGPPSEPMGGMAHPGEGGGQAQESCAFADLSLPMTGGEGAVETAAAPAFAPVAALFVAALPPARAALRLRPPLRGPPLPR